MGGLFKDGAAQKERERTMKEVCIGSIIRKRRQELGLTQEQLCHGICETVTLSRIENGRQTPSRSKVNALLQRLGMPGERYYALVSEREMEISNLQTQITSCNVLGQREQGLQKLEELEKLMEPDDQLTRQFVLRSRALLGHMENGRAVPYSFREKQMLLFRAISLTVPHFCVQNLLDNLYSVDELKVINQIALVYADYGQTKAAVDLYGQLLLYLDEHLQSLESTRPMKILVSYNYARILCMEQQNERAIEIAKQGINCSVQSGRSSCMGGLLFVIAQSLYQLHQIEESRRYFYRSYFFYSSMQDSKNAQLMKENIEEYFGEPMPCWM